MIEVTTTLTVRAVPGGTLAAGPGRAAGRHCLRAAAATGLAVGHRPRRQPRGGSVTSTKTAPASRDVTAELVFLTRALKAPTLRDAVPRLAGRARAGVLDP